MTTRESCLELKDLREAGYKNLQHWVETPGNVYTGKCQGRFTTIRNEDGDGDEGLFYYTLKQSKWYNPFGDNPDVKTSLTLYVKHLFESDLIYDIDELKGKNLGCFCHKPRKVWSRAECHNQVLVDILNKCYEPVEEMIKKKKEEESLDDMISPKSVITLTFGDAAENNVGMEKIGKTLEKGQGFNLEDLNHMKTNMERLGVNCKLINLSDFLPSEYTSDASLHAYVLVMDQAATKLVQIATHTTTITQRDMFKEQLRLKYDKKALMRGRVVNKHARWNVCFDENSRAADYEKGKGTIVGYNEVPLMKGVRDQFKKLLGNKAADLKVESNYYYDTTKCGIGWHGDSERVKVIAMRLGLGDDYMPIHFQWYFQRQPIGDRITIPLKPGDMYVMSEKAVGTDWRRQVIPTLRHATGCDKFLKN